MRLCFAAPLLLLRAPPRAVLLANADEKPQPSIAECLETAFVPAVMSMARGDVTELKLFIGAAQAGFKNGEEVDALSTAMDALPVQSAGRPLAPEESELRSQWIALAYLTLESVGTADDAETPSTLVPAALRAEYAPMVANLVRAKRDALPLSSLELDEIAPASGARGATEAALLKQAMRVVYVTLDNVESETQAGKRADAPKAPPGPSIPGTR